MTASRKALIIVGVLIAVASGLPWDGAVSTASAQAIRVDSADPGSAEQGTLGLAVTIKGNGFTSRAKAKFYKAGTTDPAGITVTSTSFIDSTQLVATIDVADTAAVALFDIAVTVGGRTGKGTGLFSVEGKRSTAPVYVAEFVETKADDPNWFPKIRGDGAGPYPADLAFGSGYAFYMTANLVDNRGIIFQFDNPYPTYGPTFGCEAWFTLAPYNRAVGYPPYALTADKIVMPDRTTFWSSDELVYDGALNRWVRIVESVTRRGTTYRGFSMTGMAPGQTSYTQLLIYFSFDDSRDRLWVNFNDTFYRELIPLDTGMRLNGGVVEVERDASGDVWYIRPISSRFPVLGNPPTEIPQYQANHALYDVQDVKGDPGGNCNLGNFLMPFELKITRIK